MEQPRIEPIQHQRDTLAAAQQWRVSTIAAYDIELLLLASAAATHAALTSSREVVKALGDEELVALYQRYAEAV